MYGLMTSDPGTVALVLSLLMWVVFGVLAVIYLAVRNNRVRRTDVYLSGEPENIVDKPSPSPANLYWGFLKKFAYGLYKQLRDKVHTGNLQDWVNFMAGWYGLLLIIAIIVGIIYLLKW